MKSKAVFNITIKYELKNLNSVCNIFSHGCVNLFTFCIALFMIGGNFLKPTAIKKISRVEIFEK